MEKLNSVLLIDDNDADNEFHTRVLKQCGLEEINVFINTRKAFAALQNGFSDFKQPPQLIFLDINMPGITGFEFLDQLRELPGVPSLLSGIKIIMLSDSTDPADYQLATQKYGDMIKGFYRKPLAVKTIEQILKKEF